jgi:hypothetical protein
LHRVFNLFPDFYMQDSDVNHAPTVPVHGGRTYYLFAQALAIAAVLSPEPEVAGCFQEAFTVS